MKPTNRRRKKLMYIVALLPILAVVYTIVGLVIVHRVNSVPFSFENNGTDLTFQSSDGLWFGEENMLRGKDFKAVVVDFELYKIQCNKPHSTLRRTKDKKRPWNEAWWFDNYRSPKWNVPYSPGKIYIHATLDRCSSQKPTAKEIASATQSAAKYIELLKDGTQKAKH